MKKTYSYIVSEFEKVVDNEILFSKNIIIIFKIIIIFSK